MKRSFLLISCVIFFACSCNPPESESDSVESDGNYRKFTTEMYPNCWFNEHTLQDEIALSGRYASVVDTAFPFSFGFSEFVKNIDQRMPRSVLVTYSVLFPETGINPSMVVSIDSADQNRFWAGVDLKDSVSTAGEWTSLKCFLTLPRRIYPEDRVRIYLWGQGAGRFYVDDLRVEFGY
jgi:hypothetical protein